MNNPLIDPYIVLKEVYTNGAYFKQALANAQIAPSSRAYTAKVCYGVLEKDVYLAYIIAKNCDKPPKTAVRLVLKIAVYMHEFMQKPRYMVADCAVELLKKLGKGGAAGFANAFLRAYALPELPCGGDERLAIEASAPLWLAKRVRRSYKSEAYNILTAPSPGVCVRIEKNGDKYLKGEYTKTPFDGVYIFRSFVRDGGYDDGDYTFQSLGSAAICSVIEPCDLLLDACAAPGGKSVLLSKKCKKIVAQELHSHRAELIRAYRARMHVENIDVRTGDAAEFSREFEGLFDAVLCDVPCSGSGVINENPDIKLFRKEEHLNEIVNEQKRILSNCAGYVKKGGSLYYSTCSVLPEENESVIHCFLEEKGDEFALCGLSCALEGRESGYGLKFLPHISSGAGFFVSRLVRK